MTAVAAMTMPLRRHDLVRLHASGWFDVLARPWDHEARACLAHWQAHDLPLVVTRQPLAADGGEHDALTLGIAAPTCWSRRRVALQVARRYVQRCSGFPPAGQVTPLLREGERRWWRLLCRDLTALGVTARVYGSHGWQALTGLAYLHASSDIDLLLPVRSAPQADQACVLLGGVDEGGRPPRIDGELMFGDGSATAWREWQRWRTGRTRELLIKRINGALLVRSEDRVAAASWAMPQAATA